MLHYFWYYRLFAHVSLSSVGLCAHVLFLRGPRRLVPGLPFYQVLLHGEHEHRPAGAGAPAQRRGRGGAVLPPDQAPATNAKRAVRFRAQGLRERGFHSSALLGGPQSCEGLGFPFNPLGI